MISTPDLRNRNLQSAGQQSLRAGMLVLVFAWIGSASLPCLAQSTRPAATRPSAMTGRTAAAEIKPCFTKSQKVKVMPLGDSITQSQNGYRGYFYRQMVDQGCSIDMVGSNKDWIVDPDPATHELDMNNEGHAGYGIGPEDDKAHYPAGELYSHIDKWLTDADPDVILLYVGTNDYGYRQPLAPVDSIEPAERHRRLVARIFEIKPNVHLFVGTMLQWGAVKDRVRHTAFNKQLIIDVADFRRQGRKCYLVDMENESRFDPDKDYMDNLVHPNKLGAEKMAKVWSKHILGLWK